jgi:O-methyltransferase domain
MRVTCIAITPDALIYSLQKSTARLILVEFVIPERPGFDFSKWADQQMMILVGGRERSESEYRSLLRASGFDLEEIVATATPLRLLVARPSKQ